MAVVPIFIISPPLKPPPPAYSFPPKAYKPIVYAIGFLFLVRSLSMPDISCPVVSTALPMPPIKPPPPPLPLFMVRKLGYSDCPALKPLIPPDMPLKVSLFMKSINPPPSNTFGLYLLLILFLAIV
jgi:hypothetical protein